MRVTAKRSADPSKRSNCKRPGNKNPSLGSQSSSTMLSTPIGRKARCAPGSVNEPMTLRKVVKKECLAVDGSTATDFSQPVKRRLGRPPKQAGAVTKPAARVHWKTQRSACAANAAVNGDVQPRKRRGRPPKNTSTVQAVTVKKEELVKVEDGDLCSPVPSPTSTQEMPFGTVPSPSDDYPLDPSMLDSVEVPSGCQLPTPSLPPPEKKVRFAALPEKTVCEKVRRFNKQRMDNRRRLFDDGMFRKKKKLTKSKELKGKRTKTTIEKKNEKKATKVKKNRKLPKRQQSPGRRRRAALNRRRLVNVYERQRNDACRDIDKLASVLCEMENDSDALDWTGIAEKMARMQLKGVSEGRSILPSAPMTALPGLVSSSIRLVPSTRSVFPPSPLAYCAHPLLDVGTVPRSSYAYHTLAFQGERSMLYGTVNI